MGTAPPAARVSDPKGIENETRICYNYLWSGAFAPPMKSVERIRRLLDDLSFLEVTWRPWELPPVPDPEAYEAARSLVLKRIVFHGPTGPVWYLGERATDKWPGFQGWVIPESPPRHMSDPGRLSVTDLLLAEAGREGHELIRLCSYEEWCEYRRRELACEPLSPGGHEGPRVADPARGGAGEASSRAASGPSQTMPARAGGGTPSCEAGPDSSLRLAGPGVHLPGFPGWQYWDGREFRYLHCPADIEGIPVGYDYVHCSRYEELIRMIRAYQQAVIERAEQIEALKTETRQREVATDAWGADEVARLRASLAQTQAELARAEADRARLQRELEEERRKMLYFCGLGDDDDPPPQALNSWISSMLDDDNEVLGRLHLHPIAHMRGMVLCWDMLCNAAQFWVPSLHLFRFGLVETCPTYEEFRFCFLSPRDGEILRPSLKEDYTEDIMRFFGWSHDEMRHFMLGRSLDVLAIVRAFGDHRIGSRTYHSHRENAFLFCILSRFLLRSGARGASPAIIDVVHQLKKGYDLIPTVLAETRKGLDVMKETRSHQGETFTGSPYLLQVWLCERLRLVKPVTNDRFWVKHYRVRTLLRQFRLIQDVPPVVEGICGGIENPTEGYKEWMRTRAGLPQRPRRSRFRGESSGTKKPKDEDDDDPATIRAKIAVLQKRLDDMEDID
ncbi:hypothetical protein NE237_023919 [Protea cynaroides]|uniref:Uncharacterized protein n=1 Tax=Protea cynaroides TaxID=273540 RepID=A0A9Q0K6H8_9MAGN|nr:hypothetical protein NE237_023919 [Protea cynaroides]